MNLEVVGPVSAIAKMDLVRFRDLFGRTWDFENSLKSAVVVESTHPDATEDRIKEMLFLLFDWTSIMRSKYFRVKERIEFKFYPVDCKNKVSFVPGQASANGRRYTLEEKREDTKDVLIINDFIPSSYFAVRNYMATTCFWYDSKEWTVVLEEKDL